MKDGKAAGIGYIDSRSRDIRGECRARKENYLEIDNGRVDARGIPTLKVNMEWSDNEKALWKDGRTTGTYSIPGFCIHEIGTARMGTDRRKSVLNTYCQTHDVKNLFVTNGVAWVSSGCANPTLTNDGVVRAGLRLYCERIF